MARAKSEDPTTGRSAVHARSTVEGILELVAHPRGTFHAAIRELTTNNYVRCRFPPEFRDRLLPLFTKRVVVEGIVAYDDLGRPLSVTDVTDIYERVPGPSLSTLRGTVPDLTRGLTPEEFVSGMREYE
jgi:hypothetical protein